MRVQKATRKYEQWLARATQINAADLELKHQHMADDLFSFFRATFYRWAELWPQACPKAEKAPRVLAVGDLHVENFGTWRDQEGRLVWGVNDFDEVYPMPYTIDLVRLAASAWIAIEASHLAVDPQEAAGAILEGYTAGIRSPGGPFVLEEQHHWLRQIATGALRDPVHFWEKMDTLRTLRGPVPSSARRWLEQMLPEPGLEYRVAHRVAGLGSLGRERYVAIAVWRGAKVAREAKALLPSAFGWVHGGKSKNEIFYEAILERAVRCRDPYVHRRGRWILRRLAAHCSRVELASLPREREEERLLHAMGWETANIHHGTPKAVAAVRDDLKKRPHDWLLKAAEAMVKATRDDWQEWRAGSKKAGSKTGAKTKKKSGAGKTAKKSGGHGAAAAG